MKKTILLSLPLVTGAVSLLLRLAQMLWGFDAATGLPNTSIFHLLSPIAMILFVVLFGVLAFRLPKEEKADVSLSAPDSLLMMVFLAGGFLLLAGGGLMAYESLQFGDLLSAVVGVLGLCSGVSVILGLFQWRQGRPDGNFFLAPSLFSVVWLLLIYRTHADYPVAERYYLDVVALAFAAWGSFRASSFFFREGSRRHSAFLLPVSITFLIGAIGSGLALESTLMLVGLACVLYGFYSAVVE